MTKFLFTTLPTNDLGLLTRSLPIARELAVRRHQVVFSSPAQAPRKLLSDSGFENLLPDHPIYDLIDVDQNFRGIVRFLFSGTRRAAP
jgi:UDP:flavonoid glycosyltransferase YjiC (YdhE family)